MNRFVAMLSASALLALSGVARAEVDFAKDVKPILESACIRCHGPEKVKGKLRLDSKEGFLKGSENGPVFIAGKADESKMYKLVNQPKSSEDRMPNEGDPLTKAQIETIQKWINEGAKWPDGLVLKSTAAGAATTTSVIPKDDPGLPISDAEKAALAKLNTAGVLAQRLALSTNFARVDFSLRSKEVKDDELAILKDIPNLVELNLGGTNITDASLAHLKSAANLTKLGLQNTKITDAGLEHLKGLTKLTSLNVYGTTVTDKGLDSLTGLKSLKHLYVWMTKVSPDGAKKLSGAIAGLDVERGYEPPPPPPPMPDKPKDPPKKPDEKKPDAKKPEEKKPDEKKPDAKKPEEKKPADKKPEEKKPDEKKPEEKK
jgi:Planctomycete cytochrome C/Leucine rich repeat